MKKFTKVLIVVAVILAVSGIACIIAGGVLGGDWKSLLHSVEELDDDRLIEHAISAEDSVKVPEDSVKAPEDAVDEVPAESAAPQQNVSAEGAEAYSAEDITSIEIELQAGLLEILVSEDENIYVHSSSDNNRIKLERQRLYVVQTSGIVQDNKVQIYLPAGVVLQEADIDLEAGDAVITRLEAAEVDIDVLTGSVQITEGITARSFSGSVDAGEMNIELLDAQLVSLDSEAGDLIVKLAGTVDDYKGELECSMGTLIYGAEEWKGIDMSTHVGHSGNRLLEAECEAGTIQISFAE